MENSNTYHRIKNLFSTNERYQRLLLVLVMVLCLVPFIDKAFHIDDPLFIWAAEQILRNPGDFYGIYVNWFSFYTPMHQCMLNPPITSYVIAGVLAVFGPNEVTLHLAFLLVAIICALGVFEIAREYGTDPLLSTLASVLSPFFLISASTVMSDVLMLAFWIWSIALWMRGVRKDSHFLLIFSAILIALCILTKYMGAIVFVLILIYHISAGKRLDLKLLYLAIPIIAVVLYEMYNLHLYGSSHLNLAASFSIGQKSSLSVIIYPLATSLVFLGGGFIGTLAVIPFTIKARKILIGFLLTAGLSVAFFFILKDHEKFRLFIPVDIWRQVQISFMIASGLYIFYMAGLRFKETRDAKTLLLLAWISGPFLFAGLVNWTVNGRTLLPAIPAVAILFVAYLDNPGSKIKRPQLKICAAVVLSAIASLLLLSADYRSANAARDSARLISEQFKYYPGQITFQGHWGFQYYMQNRGYLPIDLNSFRFKKDEIMVIPSNQNTFPVTEFLPDLFQRLKTIKSDTSSFIGVNTPHAPAGFYASCFGPAPFMLRSRLSEDYILYRANKSFRINLESLIELKSKQMSGVATDDYIKKSLRYEITD